VSANYAGDRYFRNADARDEAEFGRIPPRHEHSYVADDKLRWVEQIARLMDSRFKVPGTNFRFGLDPLMGLIPVVGGIPSAIVSVLLVSTMMRHGASGEVAVRMILNVAIDTIIGAVPIVGNIFDFAFRANDRNVRLLRAHYNEGRYQGSGRGLVAMLVVGLAAVLGLIAWGTWALVAASWRALFGA
jgi:hypothetical protein